MIKANILGLCLIVFALSPLTVSGSAHAATKSSSSSYSDTSTTADPFGLGVILGEPTGITGKYWLDGRRAIDGGIAYSWNDFLLIYSDYLYHFPDLFGHRKDLGGHVLPYVGIGLLFLSQTQDTGGRARPYFTSNEGSVGLAIRVPLGMEWRMYTAPLGFFLELVPGIGIIPSTYGFAQGGIGIRFYF